MQIFAGLTALKTAVSNQALTVSGMTDTVKLAIHRTASNTTGFALVTSHRATMGMTDGTTSRSLALLSESGTAAAVTDAGGRCDTTTCILSTTTAGIALEAEASHISFGAGTHNVSIDDPPATALLDNHIFFGGGDVSVAVRDFTGKATAGSNDAVTGLSFAPNLAIVFGRGSAAFAADTGFTGRSLVLGFAVKTAAGVIEQFCWGDAQANNTTNCRSVFRSNRCASRVTAGADQGSLELTAWNSDGATFTTRDVSDAVSVVIAFLRVPNALRAVSLLFDTNATGTKAITGIGFKPKAYFCLASALTARDTSATDTTTSKWSLGVYDQAGTQVVMGGATEDGAATANTRSYANTTEIAHIVDDGGGTEYQIQHTSLDTDGVTVEVVNAGTSDDAIGFLFFGPDAAVHSETEDITDAVVFKTNRVAAIADTEQISDAVAMHQERRLVNAETEDITDVAVLRGAAVTVASDTEDITDTFVMTQLRSHVNAETEDITDQAVLIQAFAQTYSDTEDITDECVLVQVSTTQARTFNETEDILDAAVLVTPHLVATDEEDITDTCQIVGAARLFGNDTEDITDQVLLIRGSPLICQETEDITDTCVFVERRLRAGGWRGTALQGGAVAGTALSAGSARGTIL